MEPQASPLRTAGTAGAAILWYLILSAHLFLAIGWWFLMPGGFPAEHPRFWTNRAFPIALSVAVIAASVGARNSRLEWRRAILIALGCGWFAAVVAVCVNYPRSALRGTPAPSLVVLFIIAAAFTKPLRAVRLPRRLLALILPAAAIGMLMTLAQRAPLPKTKPLNESTPTVASNASEPPDQTELSQSVIVSADPPGVAVRSERIDITVEPMLTFVSRSPDRFWTLFARRRDRAGVPLNLTAWEMTAAGMRLGYRGESTSTLTINCPTRDTTEITAHTDLPRPVYSHLNYFCRVGIRGHQRLFLEFSPCPGQLIEVTPSDYPFGRPARFAYLDERERFSIVEASSGEKGPFHALAMGDLRRSDPLVVTIHDQSEPIARLRLDDFAAQASNQLSPTAGYGVPANAVEFFLMGDSPSSPVMLYFTLASTSVGRGYDSVGHSAGVYRNKMRVELITP